MFSLWARGPHSGRNGQRRLPDCNMCSMHRVLFNSMCSLHVLHDKLEGCASLLSQVQSNRRDQECMLLLNKLVYINILINIITSSPTPKLRTCWLPSVVIAAAYTVSARDAVRVLAKNSVDFLMELLSVIMLLWCVDAMSNLCRTMYTFSCGLLILIAQRSHKRSCTVIFL